jgi:alpha-1,2-mannosyltransferase
LLLPGLAALGASVWVFGELLHTYYMGYMDLRVYYAAAETLRQGRPLYEGPVLERMPFTYPPFAAAALTVLNPIPWKQAARVMVVVSLVALALVVWLVLGRLSATTPQAPGVRWAAMAGRLGAAGALTSVLLWLEPVLFTLNMGQINLGRVHPPV